eukprot:TRINITY_DN877_c0_g2_i15.p1 TRINITY_DN877_c0_g2~~TRINITY_DN877_c0_g2_i15.p1  ORF type:complete len:311 (+),score=55.34 TRINITY_DN877_c0_g2_i15:101-1033(+)
MCIRDSSKDIAHRDLKPDNFLLDEKMHIKFSDFGSAKVCNEQKDKTRNRRGTLVGTPDYVAPEVLLTQPSDTTADLWSLGCILYELFAGKPPFKSSEGEKTREKVLWGEFFFPANFPELAKDLCIRLIKLEKKKRIGSDDFTELKQHEFFAGIDFQNLQRDKPMCEIAAQDAPKITMDPKQGINYVTISPSKLYEIDYDYYAEESPLFGSVDCKETTTKTLKEGFVSKECGWISYKKVKLVLTDEPRLMYYSVLNAYMVTGRCKFREKSRCMPRCKLSAEARIGSMCPMALKFTSLMCCVQTKRRRCTNG